MTRAERLSGFDAGFLWMETDALPLHVGTLLVLEGPAPDPAELRREVAARLRAAPWYRRRPMRMPGDLGRPIWVDHQGFDLDEHLRHEVLAAPGDRAALVDLLLRHMAGRLDPDRPLWELWQVDGLADGRWAVLAKAHHAMVDGVGGTDLIQVLLTESPTEPRPRRAPLDPRPEPGALLVVGRGVAWILLLPARAVLALVRALLAPRDVAAAVRLVLAGARVVAQPDLPPNPLSGPLGARRLWGWTGVDRGAVARVAQSEGATINDVFLAAVAGGVRAHLLRHDEPIDQIVLRTIVPVSRRSPGSRVALGNRTSALFVILPVGVADPFQRLRLIAGQTAQQKAQGVPASTDALLRVADHLPSPLLARAWRAYARAGQRRVAVAATNVAGPPGQRYLAGRRVLELLPYAPVALEVRVSFSMVSYADRLTVGITSDADAVPDLDLLVADVASAFGELVESTRAGRRPTASMAGGVGKNDEHAQSGHHRGRRSGLPRVRDGVQGRPDRPRGRVHGRPDPRDR